MPDSLGIYILSTPPRLIHQPLQPPLPIAEAETAALLHALITITETFHNPVNITLYTDSAVAYYTYVRQGLYLSEQFTFATIVCFVV
jgi:hypothetical protein